MAVLRIEHPVPDFERWKQSFDADPLGRKEAGVRGYTISRSVDDPNYVLIDLEFNNADQAGAMLASLRDLWSRVDVMRDPQARIVDVVEEEEL